MTDISELSNLLLNELPTGENVPLRSRFRALFALRMLQSNEAVDIIAKGFNDPSALLRHELAYVLGQMKNAYAIPVLERVLALRTEEAMVRHEAAEALGAIGEESTLEVLRRFVSAEDEDVQVVRETCELAIARISELAEKRRSGLVDEQVSPYASIDPAPAPSKYVSLSVSELGQMLMNTSLSMYERYKAMFALRNRGDEESVIALSKGFDDESALFRHEIAFVFGQMQHPASVPSLTQVLSDTNEMGMVRHEAAEALGSIATLECLPVLQAFMKDTERVVSESCVIGLDILESEKK